MGLHKSVYFAVKTQPANLPVTIARKPHPRLLYFAAIRHSDKGRVSSVNQGAREEGREGALITRHSVLITRPSTLDTLSPATRHSFAP